MNIDFIEWANSPFRLFCSNSSKNSYIYANILLYLIEKNNESILLENSIREELFNNYNKIDELEEDDYNKEEYNKDKTIKGKINSTLYVLENRTKCIKRTSNKNYANTNEIEIDPLIYRLMMFLENDLSKIDVNSLYSKLSDLIDLFKRLKKELNNKYENKNDNGINSFDVTYNNIINVSKDVFSILNSLNKKLLQLFQNVKEQNFLIELDLEELYEYIDSFKRITKNGCIRTLIIEISELINEIKNDEYKYINYLENEYLHSNFKHKNNISIKNSLNKLYEDINKTFSIKIDEFSKNANRIFGTIYDKFNRFSNNKGFAYDINKILDYVSKVDDKDFPEELLYLIPVQFEFMTDRSFDHLKPINKNTSSGNVAELPKIDLTKIKEKTISFDSFSKNIITTKECMVFLDNNVDCNNNFIINENNLKTDNDRDILVNLLFKEAFGEIKCKSHSKNNEFKKINNYLVNNFYIERIKK